MFPGKLAGTECPSEFLKRIPDCKFSSRLSSLQNRFCYRRRRVGIDCSRRSRHLVPWLHDLLVQNVHQRFTAAQEWHHTDTWRNSSEITDLHIHLFQWRLWTSDDIVQRIFSSFHRRRLLCLLVLVMTFLRRAGERSKVKTGQDLGASNVLQTHQQNRENRVDRCVYQFSKR